MIGGKVSISGAVEGLLDEVVFSRLVTISGGCPGAVYGKQGKSGLLQRLPGYNAAAAFTPWLVLVDLDNDFDCAPDAKTKWLNATAPKMCFRVVVREVEAWLLADRERIASFLRVRPSAVPSNPDAEPDPKETIVALARQSRRRDIREDMVPRLGSGRIIGPGYTGRLIEFVSNDDGWRPEHAMKSSDSLCRCIVRLRELTKPSEA